MQTKKKTKFSIFLKLVLLILVFIVLVYISIGFIIRFSFERNPSDFINQQARWLSEYVIKEAGIPPDTNKVKAIINESNANIRFETTGLNWTTDNEMLTINKLSKFGDFKRNEEKFMVRDKRKLYYITKIPDGYIIISPLPPREDINFERAIISIVILFTIFAAILYFSLRWIFGPIKKLSLAVEQISEGNFETEIDVKRNDELGNLAMSITEMKKSISNMIKSKETLLIDVSHELRSPLTRIKLANEFVEDEKIKSKIREDVKEMEAMITELLETYRLESVNERLNKQENDIIELIERVVSKFDERKIILLKESNKITALFDKEKMEIVIRNILDNAVKYSDGKPVEIRIYRNPEKRHETLISIKDNGKGIEERELEKIFEPFYRTDKSRDKKIKGYGLGLSLVKKILDEHKAELEVKSKINEGTEFIIHLSESH